MNEFDVGDQVAFATHEGAVVKAIVKGITQNLVTDKIFYHVKEERTGIESVVCENELLFAEVSWARPLFAVGMTVEDIHGAKGMIESISIDIEDSVYTIQYSLDSEEVVDEDDVLFVKRA